MVEEEEVTQLLLEVAEVEVEDREVQDQRPPAHLLELVVLAPQDKNTLLPWREVQVVVLLGQGPQMEVFSMVSLQAEGEEQEIPMPQTLMMVVPLQEVWLEARVQAVEVVVELVSLLLEVMEAVQHNQAMVQVEEELIRLHHLLRQVVMALLNYGFITLISV